MNLQGIFSKNNQISNLMKIRPMGGAQLFHVYRRTDGHDEADTRFSKFCDRALILWRRN
jgi:hypothetical protein